jgi:hypothetical protein
MIWGQIVCFYNVAKTTLNNTSLLLYFALKVLLQMVWKMALEIMWGNPIFLYTWVGGKLL